MLRIRRMQPEDMATVAELTSQLGYPATELELKRRFELLKDRADAGLFVALDDRRVVGWTHVAATYLLEADPRAEIWGLVVLESARGTGAGRALVEAAEQWARNLGFRTISLRSNVIRERARGFYEHLGYTIAKTQNAFRKQISK